MSNSATSTTAAAGDVGLSTDRLKRIDPVMQSYVDGGIVAWFEAGLPVR